MPRKRPQRTQVLPPPVPRDRGQRRGCWQLRPVDSSGKISAHQVRERYEGPARLIECPGTDHEPAGPVVHAPRADRRV
jgi:hypothetical protein